MVAKNELGQLFVDIGIGGLGKTLKGLNSVSASFLLTKNAAQQMLQPLMNFSKQGANTVTTFDKINSVTGLTIQQLQEIKNQSKLANTDFNTIIGDIEKFQQNMILLKTQGTGALNQLTAMTGVLFDNIDFDKPYEALQRIVGQVQNIKDESVRAFALQNLGISPDLMYYFEHIKDYNKSLNLSDKEFERGRKQQEQWNKIALTFDKFGEKFIANSDLWLEALTKFANSLDKFTSWVLNIQKGTKGDTQARNQAIDQTLSTGADFTKKYLNPLTYTNKIDEAAKNTVNTAMEYFKYKSGMPTGGASNIDNRTINITQNIQGSNADLIAQKSADLLTNQDLNILNDSNRIIK